MDTQHPLQTRQYAIYTPPMDEMIRNIGDWIDQKFTGGYIYGPSRYGKTKTVKWFLEAELNLRFQSKLPLIVWSRPHSVVSENDFWVNLLRATSFRFVSNKSYPRKIVARFLFIEQLITLAASSNNNYIVLMIDEAHDVTLNEWKWLLGLQNDLDNQGFRLSIFSIASHQIGYQPDYLARTGNAHIAARFFGVGARFHGVRSSDELAYILNGYDLDSEWPPDTGTSFLKYCAPTEFELGNRLAKHSKLFWEVFEQSLPRELAAGVKPWAVELPMQHIASTVEILLHSLSQGNHWENVISHNNIKKIVSNTGFSNFLRFVTAPS